MSWSSQATEPSTANLGPNASAMSSRPGAQMEEVRSPRFRQRTRSAAGYAASTIEFHFFFSFDLSVAVTADAEIFSDNSAQVLRTSAVISEQLSIWRKTRLASSR